MATAHETSGRVATDLFTQRLITLIRSQPDDKKATVRMRHPHPLRAHSEAHWLCAEDNVLCAARAQVWVKSMTQVADTAFKATEFQLAYVIVRTAVHCAHASQDEGEAREQLARRYQFMLDTIVKPIAKGRKDGPPKVLYVRDVLVGAAPEILAALATKVRARLPPHPPTCLKAMLPFDRRTGTPCAPATNAC